MGKKIKHLMYVPFTGLGLYNGFRGERWFRNRLKIFQQFVIPSLLVQTNKDFTVWISFTRDQKGHPLVEKLGYYLDSVGLNHVFTYSGICFYDDKYPKEQARTRLIENLHGSMGELLDEIGEVDYVYMTIQPSDDCYYRLAVQEIHEVLKTKEAVGYRHGYIMNYLTGEVSDYNPTTNPPFYTLKFDRETFIDPLKHYQYTALKHDVPGYEAGIALPSHEWVKDCLDYELINKRGFLVGTHSENISTYYNHPFKGQEVVLDILRHFGLERVGRLELPYSLKKALFRKLPFKLQRKLRYIFGEKLINKLYEYLRT